MSKRLQGDQGEAVAILHYTRLGYTVSKPLTEACRYDLIVDRGELQRVQVKSTTFHNKNGRFFLVHLETNGANYTTKTNLKKISTDECDLVFVVDGSGTAWEFPVKEAANRVQITLDQSRECFIVGHYPPILP